MSKAVVQAGNRKVPETDGGYANARMRGMRANLLPTAFFDRLIVATDVGQVVKELMTTEYGPDLEAELVHGRTAAVIDGALKDNMVRAYQKVLSFLHPSARTLLSTLLGRWDVFNIKTIIRGAHNKVPLDEMKASFFPAGYLSEEELEALAQFDDVGAVINTMAMWGLPYAAPLRQAFPCLHRGPRPGTARARARQAVHVVGFRATHGPLPGYGDRTQDPGDADRHREPGDGAPASQGRHRRPPGQGLLPGGRHGDQPGPLPGVGRDVGRG